MRRTFWICGWIAALSGCGDHDGATEPAPPVTLAESQVDLEAYRCRILNPVWVRVGEGAANPWIVRGGDGPTIFSSLRAAGTGWNVGSTAGVIPPVDSLRAGSIVWTGRRWLALNQNRLESYGPAFGDRSPVRVSLPSGATDVTLVEIPGHAALVGHRPVRGLGSGSAFVQMLGPDGEAVGPLRPLGVESGLLVNTVRGRWDFGRLVLTANDDDRQNAPFWVLDPEGVPLRNGTEGAMVACPRGGCLRISVAQDAAATGEIRPDVQGVLRVESLDLNTSFTTNTPATTLRAVVVSGDRVLVMMHPADGVVGCDVRVIDVSRRAVVGDGNEFHEDGLSCEAQRVRPTARGFVMAIHDPAHGVGSRSIECGR